MSFHQKAADVQACLPFANVAIDSECGYLEKRERLPAIIRTRLEILLIYNKLPRYLLTTFYNQIS